MKRTTIMLPDELAAKLGAELRRHDVSAAATIREALEHHLLESDPKDLGFIGIADSGRSVGWRSNLRHSWQRIRQTKLPTTEATGVKSMNGFGHRAGARENL